jgi:ribonucleoside-diphosphate reductase alpha chain
MRFTRCFTGPAGPYVGVAWVARETVVRDRDGTARVAVASTLVPSMWSQDATDILVTKYARRAGVPDQTVRVEELGVPAWLWRSVPAEGTRLGRELDARQIFRRLAGCWTYHGWRGGYFDTEEDAHVFFDEAQALLVQQRFAPNSPQWFNTGLHWAYGIEGEAHGHYRVDPATGVPGETTSAYEYVSGSACYILGVEDSLLGPKSITDTVTREALIFKMGSGAGSNFSEIRGEGEPLTGGGTSSGFMSFTTVDDRAAGAIKSGGRTRRAAKLKALDMDHPDIEKFIKWKPVEEQKVASLLVGSKLLARHLERIMQACTLDGGTDPRRNTALRRALREARKSEVPDNYLERALLLAAQGVTRFDVPVYTDDFNGEAYATVSGQNSNNSVSVVDEFMHRAAHDLDWPLYWRTELRRAREEGRAPAPCRVVRASVLERQVAEAAWHAADPGVQFRTRMNEWHTCPASGEIRATNPCSEYLFVDETSCTLASIALTRFFDAATGVFDVPGYLAAVRVAMVVLDVTIHAGQYPSASVALQTYRHRTVGLGYADLGALLMRWGVAYDSERGRATAAALSALLTLHAYRVSAEMAQTLGTFPAYPENRDALLRVLRNHGRAARGESRGYEGLTVLPRPLDQQSCPRPLWEAVQVEQAALLEEAPVRGVRNAQVTVMAPTGTISFVMGCDTTSVEPDFALIKYKLLAGGGLMRLVNTSFPTALRNLGYQDDQVEAITRYVIGHRGWVGLTRDNLKGLAPLLDDPEVRERVDARLGVVSDLRYVLTRDTLGDEWWGRLGLGDGGDAVAALDLEGEALERLNNHVYGHETVEGAPGLDSRHLTVFDCANPPRKNGIRCLAPEAHVLMVAAIQPFVTGGVSKTVNGPAEMTIEDIVRLHRFAWSQGCKSIAVYRDRSKLSSPLGTTSPLLALGEEEPVPEKVVEGPVRYVTRKTPLPNRRHAYNQKVKIAGQTVLIGTGEYPDGRLGEVILNCYVNGTPIQTLLHVIGQLISVGLQHGVPVSEYVDKLLHVSFAPQGPVQGDDCVRMAQSILDYVGKHLGIRYDGRTDMIPAELRDQGVLDAGVGRLGARNGTAARGNGYRAGESGETHSGPRELSPTRGERAPDLAVVSLPRGSYNGEVCPQCLQGTVRVTGTCRYCDTCQESLGGCG